MSNYQLAQGYTEKAKRYSEEAAIACATAGNTYATLALVDEIKSIRELVEERFPLPILMNEELEAEATTHRDIVYVVATDAREAFRKYMDDKIHLTHESAKTEVRSPLQVVYRITLEVVQE